MKDQEIITHRIEIENFLKEFDTRFDEGNMGEILKELKTIGEALPKDLMEELARVVTSCGKKCESCSKKETCPIRGITLKN